jgi:acyl-coenzyme A synthetase/AMP-(fatty) acid ligase
VSSGDLELIEFLRPRISKIKLRRLIVFIEALPRNAYGKVLKLELQEELRNFNSDIASEGNTVAPERNA